MVLSKQEQGSHKMTASFAITADDFSGDSTPKQPALRRSFDKSAKTVNTNRRASTQGDSMMGGVVLDALFSAIFPGLGNVFNGLSLMDTVSLYDTFRDATAPTGRELALRTHYPVTKPVPAYRQLLSMVFG
jgi:hypothetical protein